MNETKEISWVRVVTFDDTPGGRLKGESYADSLKDARDNLISAQEDVRQAERAERFSTNAGGCWERENPVDQAVSALAESDDDAVIEALGYFDVAEAKVREAISEYELWDRSEPSEWRFIKARLVAEAAELVLDIFSGQKSVDEVTKHYPRAIVEIEYLDKEEK